jgi:hypothetical protein
VNNSTAAIRTANRNNHPVCRNACRGGRVRVGVNEDRIRGRMNRSCDLFKSSVVGKRLSQLWSPSVV